MEIQLGLYLPRDVASVPVTRQVLDGCLETLGVTPDTRDDIALALTEACANVVQHAGPGEEYEVRVSARRRKCVIEVVNTTREDGAVRDGHRPDQESGARLSVGAEPVPASAEHGRGLKIIDAITDNLQLTGNGHQGTVVHFEKTLEWLPGAAGQHLFSVDGPA
jgi:serine/threonine-protein kinase RsbW